MNEILNLIHELSAVVDDADGGVLSLRVGLSGEPIVHVSPEFFFKSFTDYQISQIENKYNAERNLDVRTIVDGVEFTALLTEVEYEKLTGEKVKVGEVV